MGVEMLLPSGLEKRANFARRRAFIGDLEGAKAAYKTLWPDTKYLRADRRIRFLAQYADVLARTQSLMAFETIRVLAEEVLDVWNGLDSHQDEARAARRHLKHLLGTLLKVVREVGDQSAIGQVALKQVWALAPAMDLESGERADHFRPLRENGRIIWITRIDERYRLIRNPCG